MVTIIGDAMRVTMALRMARGDVVVGGGGERITKRRRKSDGVDGKKKRLNMSFYVNLLFVCQ